MDAANELFGVRLNVWTAAVGIVGALAYLLLSTRRRPGRETPSELMRRPPALAQTAPV